MDLLEIGNAVVYALGIAATLGVPPVITLYRRALRREIAFSPALAFAYTYVDHFVEPLHARLASGRPLRVDGQAVERLYVRMPRALADVAGGPRLPAPEPGRPSLSMKEVTVETPAGKRTLRIRCAGEERLAFDVPRVLETLEPIIMDHLGASRAREGARFEQMERREVQAFCRHVRALVRARGFQDRIRVFDCDLAELTAETDDLDADRPVTWLRRLRDRLRPPRPA
jgi:hypothetical protein